MVLHAEQKSIAVLKEIISRFSQAGDVGVDLFDGTFSTAVACFDLPEHRKFVGCEKQKRWYTHVKDHVTRRCATSVVEKASGI